MSPNLSTSSASSSLQVPLGAQGIDAKRLELVQLANGREIRHPFGFDQPRDALGLLGGQLAIVIVIVVGKQARAEHHP